MSWHLEILQLRPYPDLRWNSSPFSHQVHQLLPPEFCLTRNSCSGERAFDILSKLNKFMAVKFVVFSLVTGDNAIFLLLFLPLLLSFWKQNNVQNTCLTCFKVLNGKENLKSWSESTSTKKVCICHTDQQRKKFIHSQFLFRISKVGMLQTCH